MNLLPLAVLFLAAAGGSVEARRRPGGQGGSSPSPCGRALAPTRDEAELFSAAITTCIAEQDGLQDIIDELKASVSGGKGCSDIAALLESGDYTAEATAFRECFADEMGMLATDGTIDMDALKAAISDKVTGLSIEANTQLGLDNCPDVEEFDVSGYLECILAYCSTGAAP